MAIYDAQLSTISRSAGRSATAAAAYRAGMRIVDARTGEIHDYVRKVGVVSSRIVMPAGCAWAPSASELWNAAELAEKRINSTVAREWLVALPHELPDHERQALAERMAQDIAARYHVAAHVSVHAPPRGGDGRNYHAHILFTTRVIDGDGAGLGAKTRVLDDRKTGPSEVKWLRERWEHLVNDALARVGCGARVSGARRSDSVPRSVHLGPAATALERRGVATAPGDHNRAVQRVRQVYAAYTAQEAAARASLEALEQRLESEIRAQALERCIAHLQEAKRAADAARQALAAHDARGWLYRLMHRKERARIMRDASRAQGLVDRVARVVHGIDSIPMVMLQRIRDEIDIEVVCSALSEISTTKRLDHLRAQTHLASEPEPSMPPSCSRDPMLEREKGSLGRRMNTGGQRTDLGP